MGQGDLTVKKDLAVVGDLTVGGDGLFAIGFIAMFSGTWTDNVTMPGWYACIAANAAHGCPPLVDKFVFGGSASGASGGSNTMLDHTHTVGNQTASHTHTGGAHTHAVRTKHVVGAGNNVGQATSGNIIDQAGMALSSAIGALTNQSASHTHVVGAGSVPTSTENRPAYYTLIFIRKCYN